MILSEGNVDNALKRVWMMFLKGAWMILSEKSVDSIFR